MSKDLKKYIEKTIKVLFEQEVSEIPEEEISFDEMIKFLDTEKTKTAADIAANRKIKGVLVDPKERSVKDTQIQLGLKKLKDVEALEKNTLQQQKDHTEFLKKQAEELKKQALQQKTTETTTQMTEVENINPVIQSQKHKNKVVIVKFDTATKAPFQVKYSERGFSINGIRLSFEFLETALSKKIILTLEDGFILDLVKMQKIVNKKPEVDKILNQETPAAQIIAPTKQAV